MALIACPECKSSVSDQAVNCPQCGYPLGTRPRTSAPEKRLHPDYVRPEREAVMATGMPSVVVKHAKSRGIYIILGLFLGLLGIHNFYAGYFGRGLVQLLLVVFLGWAVIGLVVVGVWVLVELRVVTRDAAGDPLV